MLPNPHRAETVLILNGKAERLCLNLGALAALEAALGANTLSELLARFSEENYSATDIAKVLDAGLYGAKSNVDIYSAQIEGGAVAAAKAAIELLVHGLGVAK